MPTPLPVPSTNDDATRLLGVVRALARELRPELDAGRYGLDHSLERDFGLDSLARVELQTRLQREFAPVPAAALDAEALAAADTPRQLLDLIAAPAAPVPAAAVVLPPAAPPQTRERPDAATLTGLLDWHADRHPEATYIRLFAETASPPQDIAYGRLRDEARALAGGLLAHGLAAGDRVAIMLPTCRGFFAAFFGILYAGGVPVPLYPPARPSQLEEHMRRIAGIVADAGATALIADPRARLLGRLLRTECAALRVVATVDELLPASPPPALPGAASGDIAFLQYTSGSTGQPKGVVLTHANLLANLRAMEAASGVTADDVFVSWLPLYHDMGLIGACLGALAVGFRLVLLSPLTFLADPERWLRTIAAEGGTVSAAPNFAYEICATKLDAAALAGLDLSHWRLAFNGAEPVAAGTLERFCERFAGCGFARTAMTPVYGLAENSVGLCFPPPGRGPRIDTVARAPLAAGEARPAAAGDPHPQRIVGCGRVLPGHELRIADARGRPLPERRVGRVQFRGPSATRGYFGHADPGLFDGDWLNTGDLGYLADGELYLTGRSKDIIIRGGRNLYPQELEEAIGTLPGVRRGGVAVFAADDPRSGSERLVVVVETALADAGARERLARAVADLAIDVLGQPADDVVLAPPRTVLKTSSGKIRRSACRERYERGELVRGAPAPWLQLVHLGLGGALRAAAAGAWAAWAWTVFVAVVPPAWLLVTLAPTLALRRRCARRCARLALAACGLRLRVEGLPELTRAPRCVIVANHASYLDGLVLTAALPPRFAYIAKRELAAQPLAAIPLRRLGCAFVERFDNVRGIEDTRELAARAAAGDSLLFFPEGTFRAAPGLLPFRLGAFAVAAGSGLPVVPLCLRGTRRLLPEGRWRPRRSRLEVLIGPPLGADSAAWSDALRLRDATRDWIGRRVEDGDGATETPARAAPG
ncbi:AMP-binding protein [Azospira restricta]|uniref:AMP-binding protein n=1 Tax=Azospira restricta TaxID=404405 RepID=A0A974PWV5_9RHOO|nr:AMP-binding protein [Azospira restricta]QRJ62967.1 AMP-binding protein [Azospira restricta]